MVATFFALHTLCRLDRSVRNYPDFVVIEIGRFAEAHADDLVRGKLAVCADGDGRAEFAVDLAGCEELCNLSAESLVNGSGGAAGMLDAFEFVDDKDIALDL